jgi:hypothetical protein
MIILAAPIILAHAAPRYLQRSENMPMYKEFQIARPIGSTFVIARYIARKIDPRSSNAEYNTLALDGAALNLDYTPIAKPPPPCKQCKKVAHG